MHLSIWWFWDWVFLFHSASVAVVLRFVLALGFANLAAGCSSCPGVIGQNRLKRASESWVF